MFQLLTIRVTSVSKSFPFSGVRLFAGLIALLVVNDRVASRCLAADDEKLQADLQFFEAKIRPLLIEKCVDCHGPEKQESDLRLDKYAAMLSGGVSGPAIVPGKADESLMIAAIHYKDAALQMPPDGKLADAEIELLKDWVNRGAPHPEASDTAPSVAPRRTPIDLEEARKFWAFRSLTRPAIPVVQDDQWVQTPIDAFILATLRSQGLRPNRPADKVTLIRRMTYDMTGLPPSPEDVAEFLADDSPGAVARLVDRLLESKEYGEHWGRHWLDIARYADSNGLDENVAHGNAWRYRDYVVRSLNQDKPLDRFIIEQIAGDLLAKQELASAGVPADADPSTIAVSPEVADLRIATGFLALGPKVLAEADKVKMRMDIIDEQIDTIGKAFMGLTFGCARCHDHKFDPISTADYYAMAGILGSTQTMETFKTVAKWHENPIASEGLIASRASHQKRIDAQKAKIDARFTAAVAVLRAEQAATKAAEAKAAADAAKDAADKAAAAQQAADKAAAEAAKVNGVANPQAAASDAPGNAQAAAPQEVPAATLQNAQTAAAAPPQEKPEELEAKFPEAVRSELKGLRDELAALEKAMPPLPTAMGVKDEAEITDQKIHVRGSHLTLGASVPRGVPVVLTPGEPIAMPPASSGRLELAKWLVSPDNPLTPRVLVNRVWRWHFGRGLVPSVDNFGLLGEAPTHPELLEWLASELPRCGWSLKSLHRLILLSSTYQMSSEPDEASVAIDQDNRYWWRADIRRLEAESIRDGLLAASGRLDRSTGGSMLHVGNHEFIFNHTSKDETNYDTTRRSLYLPVIRNNLYDGFTLFDYSTADVVNGDRQASTVAPQALFMLNSEIVLSSAEALADRLLREEAADDRQRVDRLYAMTLSRYPETEESAAVLDFLAKFQAEQPAPPTPAAAPSAEVTPDAPAPDASQPGQGSAPAGEATAKEPAAPKAPVDPRREAWVAICQGLLISNEFYYLH